MQRAEDRARELSHSGKSRLRIAFGPQDGLNWIVDVATHLSEHQIQLDLVSAGRRSPAQWVQAGEADLALEIGDIHFPGVRRIKICDDELVCIMAPDHGLAEAASITVENIAGETYFAHSLVPQPGFESEAFFRRSQERPIHVAHVESLEAIVSLVSAGHGLSIQPRAAIVRAESAKKILSKSLSPAPVLQSWFLHLNAGIPEVHGEPFLGGLVDTLCHCLTAT